MTVGARTKISSGVSIECADIGEDVVIYSGVRIGQSGFGFAPTKTGHVKIPQVGQVVIGNDVEIGANSCIDRGSTDNTVIGDGTFLDNLVHVAHNVKIGKHCAIAGQVGIAGSAVIGDYVAFGGKASVAGHLEVGNHAKLAAKSGVTKSLPGNETYAGMPARKISKKNKQDALLSRLPKMMKQLKALDKRLAQLDKNG